MSECPAPLVPENAAVPRPQSLTSETIDGILADFRTWIERAAAEGTLPCADDLHQEEPLDLHTLLGQFTALRHEVNLQTRAVRAQQEQNADTLKQYGESLETLHASQTAAAQPSEPDSDELLRPLLKDLVDAYDALALARREVERVHIVLLPVLERLAQAPEPLPEPEPEVESSPVPPAPGFWARLFGRREWTAPSQPRMSEATLVRHRRALERQWAQLNEAAEAAHRALLFVDSVLTGYTMSLQRLERTLQHCELEPIPCVGEPFDPELMEVVEVATDTDCPANEVVDEVRRGYLWRDRVFRYAQVRVAKP